MAIALIKLVYKQVIDASAQGSFERNVFHTTYDEFKMKSQAYNLEGKFKTFTELKANDGKANSLHYKISFAAGHFVEGLKNRTPELADNLGNAIAFDIAKLELIESDLTNAEAHKLAVNFITDTMVLYNIIGEYLVLGKYDAAATGPTETFIIKMQPHLSIVEYQPIDQSITNTYVPIHNN